MFFAKQLEVVTRQQADAPSHRSIHKIDFLQFQVSVRAKKMQLSQRGNNCHKRFLTEVSVNGGIVM